MGAIIAIAGFALAVVAIPTIMIVGPRLARPKTKLPHLPCDVRVEGCPYELDAVSDLIRDFLTKWGRLFGELQMRRIIDAWGMLDIVFVAQPFEYRSAAGKLNGVTEKKTRVRVVVIGNSPRRTALGHELIHSALWILNGEPDPDHIDKAYRGWTAEHDQIERELRA